MGIFAYIFLKIISENCFVKNHKYNSNIKNVGSKLKEIRQQKLISQEQLANMCDIEISQISRIERGIINTSIGNIFMLAEKLGIEPKELFEF